MIGGFRCNMRTFFRKTTPVKVQMHKNTDLIAYAEKLTKITLNDICTEGNGEIEISGKEEYAYICLSLTEDGKTKLRKRLKQRNLKPFDGKYTLPGFEDHDIAKKMKSETILDWYTLFLSGTGGAMTRSVELYLTETEEGKNCLYLFG